MEEEEFVDYVKTLHEQNLNGREDFLQAFEKGIRAAYAELQQVKSVDLADVSKRNWFERRLKIFNRVGIHHLIKYNER